MQPATDSSPLQSVSHPAVSRRLDFEQDESSLQETPALSGSGQRRGIRRSIYSIEPSPSRNTMIMEENIQEEIGAGEDSIMIDVVGEASELLDDEEDDTAISAEAGVHADTETELELEPEPEPEPEPEAEAEESEEAPEPIKAPAKRGRKRKSDALVAAEPAQDVPAPRKRGPKPKDKSVAAPVAAPVAAARRSKRVSDMSEQDSSILDASAGAVEDTENTPVLPRPRGRPPKVKAQPPTAPKAKTQSEMAPPPKKQAKEAKQAKSAKDVEASTEKESPVFKKPALPKSKKKAEPKTSKPEPETIVNGDGKLVDIHGNPISKAEIDQMSTVSTGTRYGRGRHLSVFRELEPESATTIGRTGRHRVKPVEFWANDKVSYDPKGNMQAILHHVYAEPPPKKPVTRGKGKKKTMSAVEEEDEVELEPWEEEEGVFEGIYRGYDPDAKVTTNEKIERRESSPLIP